MSYETTTDYEKDFEESMWAQLRRKNYAGQRDEGYCLWLSLMLSLFDFKNQRPGLAERPSTGLRHAKGFRIVRAL
ncbi:MAG: hypothetical protein UZ09_BCD002001940 [Bacteroidetes bacterium OLB9]|nr:MAG: hypothetical protein UZ09_BCD002001940 [Bacteroidetes bacterium OLB9]